MTVSVYLSVYERAYLQKYTSSLNYFFVHDTSGRGSVLLWRRSDMLCTSGFMDDVMFANKPRLLDVAAQLKRTQQAHTQPWAWL